MTHDISPVQRLVALETRMTQANLRTNVLRKQFKLVVAVCVLTLASNAVLVVALVFAAR